MPPTTKHLWTALLVAVLILAAALWPTGNGPGAEAAPAARTTYTITVPAAAFTPGLDGQDYTSGGFMHVTSGMGYFVAPVFFPQPVVTVQGITLHAYDNGGHDVLVGMLRERPATGGEAQMVSLTSSGQSTTDPRSFPTNTISYRTVNSRYHGVYLLLLLPGGPDYKFYGVTIRYQA